MTRNVHVLVEKFYYLNSRYRLKVGPFTPFGKPFQEIFIRNICARMCISMLRAS